MVVHLGEQASSVLAHDLINGVEHNMFPATGRYIVDWDLLLCEHLAGRNTPVRLRLCTKPTNRKSINFFW